MTDDLISRQMAIDAIMDESIVANMDSVYDSELHRCKRATHRILANLPSAQQWIPCSERLPEEGIEVVTANKDGDYEINHIIDKEDGEWFWEKAIAWMPIPEPPKKVGDEE